MKFTNQDGAFVSSYLKKCQLSLDGAISNIEPIMFDIVTENAALRAFNQVDKNFVFFGQIVGLPLSTLSGLLFRTIDLANFDPALAVSLTIPTTSSSSVGTAIIIDDYIFNDWYLGTYLPLTHGGKWIFKGYKITYKV